MDLISIIVPCYNESEALPLFMKEMCNVMEGMNQQKFEIILVNDGSSDNTLEVIHKFAEGDRRVKFISFSRNFGKEAAIYAGLQHAKGDFIAMLDADLQDPPSLLPEMYRSLKEERFDSVATRRVTRKGEPPVRSFFARLFYKLINKMADIEIVDGARDFRLMNRKYVNALLKLAEKNRFSKGLFGWVGFRTKWIEFENVERVAGKTKWSFWSLLKYSIEGIVAFTTTPLVISSVIGLLFCVFALLVVVLIVVRKTIWGDPVDGWASLVCIITFLGGVQLFCLGIVGQYMAKMYLEIKNRPVYIIDEDNMTPIC